MVRASGHKDFAVKKVSKLFQSLEKVPGNKVRSDIDNRTVKQLLSAAEENLNHRRRNYYHVYICVYFFYRRYRRCTESACHVTMEFECTA